MPFAITHQGLRIEQVLVPENANEGKHFIAVLDCDDSRDLCAH